MYHKIRHLQICVSVRQRQETRAITYAENEITAGGQKKEMGLLRPIPTSVTELLSGLAELLSSAFHSIKHCLISEDMEEWKNFCDPVTGML